MADNTISYKNRLFQILPNKYRISFAKAQVMVEKRLDDSIQIKYKEQYLNYKEIYPDETYEAKPSFNTLVLNDLVTSDIFTLHQG